MALSASACSKPPTVLMLAFVSDVPVEELSQIEIDWSFNGNQNIISLNLSASGVELPGTYAIQQKPDTDSEASDPLDLKITVRTRTADPILGTSDVISRRVITSFSDENVKLLTIPIQYSCYGSASIDEPICTAPQTCRGGGCINSNISVDSLPEYSDSLVFVKSSSGKCFDRSSCTASEPILPSASILKELKGETCSVDIPPTVDVDLSTLNIFIHWPFATDKDAFSVVDKDAEFGWKVESNTISFTPGLCSRIKSLILSDLRIVATNTCATKTAEIPYCSD